MVSKKVDPYKEVDDIASDTSVSTSTQSNGSVQLDGVPKTKGQGNNHQNNHQNDEDAADVNSDVGVKSSNHRSVALENKNTLIFVRNSEHMNKCFPDWMAHNFKEGKYKTSDMNQPKRMHTRVSPVPNFGLDPPLTVFGGRLANLLGKEIQRKFTISAVYSSPSLRCIETAVKLIESQTNNQLKIRVEPALYDFHLQSSKSFPTFLTKDELVANQIKIDDAYEPFVSVEQLEKIHRSETPSSFAKRCQETMQTIIKSQKSFGVVLVVTHACNLHTTARALTARSQKRKGAAIFPTATAKELEQVTPNYPFCSMIGLQPIHIFENTTTANLTKFLGGEKYHILGGDGPTSYIHESQWGQIDMMPSFNSSKFSNRFNHSFFLKAA